MSDAAAAGTKPSMDPKELKRPRAAAGRDTAEPTSIAQFGQGEPRPIHAIARLRKKIEEKPHKPRYIHTVHGDGYYLAPNGQTDVP